MQELLAILLRGLHVALGNRGHKGPVLIQRHLGAVIEDGDDGVPLLGWSGRSGRHGRLGGLTPGASQEKCEHAESFHSGIDFSVSLSRAKSMPATRRRGV